MAATIVVGVARATITPPVGSTWQGGYGARTRPAQGIHDHLYATALVLQGPAADAAGRVALVTADLVGLSADQVERVRRLVDAHGAVRGERVMMCCSHTHGGPATRKSASLPVNDAYVAALEQHLAGVVYAAARELRPVTIGLARSQATFNVNRRLRTPDGETVMRPNHEGPVDRSVAVVRLDDVPAGRANAQGGGSRADERAETPVVATTGAPEHPPSGEAPFAVLFRYTCHATALGGQNYLFTADYPGAARRFVERAYGADASGQRPTTALFLPGCFGNVRPNLTDAEGRFRSATWPELDALGRQLGSAAVQASEAVRDPTAPRSAPGVRGESALSGPVGAASTWIDLPLEPNAPGRHAWPAEVQVLRLGGLYLVGLPGEVFVEIGFLTQQAAAAAAGVPPAQVLVQGYSNGSVGYVPSAAAIPEGGYEVNAWKMSERPAGFTGDAERLLADTAAGLAAQLAAGR